MGSSAGGKSWWSFPLPEKHSHFPSVSIPAGTSLSSPGTHTARWRGGGTGEKMVLRIITEENARKRWCFERTELRREGKEIVKELERIERTEARVKKRITQGNCSVSRGRNLEEKERKVRRSLSVLKGRQR